MAVRGTPVVGSATLAARYPFLPGAARWIEGISLNLEELLESPAYAPARALGRDRVRVAVQDPSGESIPPGLETAPEVDRILSFVYARFLVSLPPDLALARRWCVAEAKAAWKSLTRRDASPEETVALAREMGYEVAEGSSGTHRGSLVSFSLPSYLRLSAPLREAKFRLIHQLVQKGRVELPWKDAARVLQEGIRAHLLASVPVAMDAALASRLRDREGPLLETLLSGLPAGTARGPGAFDARGLPPCMREMRQMLERGENLSHFGRFSLAAFLHKAGADREYIVDSYRGAPDFDEGITRYQVDHILQHDGGKGYKPPDCASLQANGLCFRERDDSRPSLCADPALHSPWNYYRRRRKALGAPEPPTPSGTST